MAGAARSGHKTRSARTGGGPGETVKEVEALDRRVVARQADVRDEAGLRAASGAGVAEPGPVDIVLANAGIAPMSMNEPHEAWQDVIDVSLTGITVPVGAGFTNKN